MRRRVFPPQFAGVSVPTRSYVALRGSDQSTVCPSVSHASVPAALVADARVGARDGHVGSDRIAHAQSRNRIPLLPVLSGDSMQQRSYVRLTFISCAIGLVLSAALNFAVDPYGVHRWIDRAGFNRLKPKSEFHSQMVKPYRVLEVRPKTLLLGNSRVEVGINPESPQWPAALRPVYNMALPGTGVATSLRSLQHANSNSKVDLVVMGVDFFDFLSSDQVAAPGPGKPRGPSEFDKRLLVNTDGARNQQRWLQ